ncbi:MAG TPA: carboxypeptidase-like regulatory domain-containing protein [Acidimicrobiia bacterium]
MRKRVWPVAVALGLVTSLVAGPGIGLAAEEDEGAGNNLSTPVIFAEGYGLSGIAVDPAVITTTGLPGLLKPACSGVEYWGAGSNAVAFPMNGDLFQLEIDNTVYAEAEGQTTATAGDYFLQPYSLVPLAGGTADQFGNETCWEADWADGSAIDTVDVNFLDVGDSLVRVLRKEGSSPNRVEFVLYQSTDTAGTFQDGTELDGYPMTQLWPPGFSDGKPPTVGGGDRLEVWATADSSGAGAKVPAELASVYTRNADLKIDKLTWSVVPDSFTDPSLDGYPSGVIPDTLDDGYEKWVDDVIYDGGFAAEVNQGGTVLYGYNWGLGTGVEAGWYRITMSIDGANAEITGLNPTDTTVGEEELALAAPGGGDTSSGAFFPPTLVEDIDGNYVYVDVYVAESGTTGKGKMTGKVTTTGGASLAGRDVTVYHPNGDPAALAVTGADGSFEIDLATGTYNVGVKDASGNYWSEFYDDRATLDTADDVVLGDGDTAYLEIALSKVGVEPPPGVDDDDDTVAPGHFKDVYWNNMFYADIEWMWAAGITRGCNPPDNDEFCPVRAVTRAEMASFFVRALGLTEGGDVDRFADDDGSTHETDINRLAAAGITKGCNPPDNDEYCPEREVSRAEMASMIVRALGLTEGGDVDRFVDDDGSTHETDINRLAASGITKGCNPSTENDRFCPGDSVLREQMAAFFHRASPWWE